MKVAYAFLCLCAVAIVHGGAPPAPWSVTRTSDGRREIRIHAGGEQGRAFRYNLDCGQLVGVEMGNGLSMDWLPVAGAERLRDVQWSEGYPVIHRRSGGASIVECPQIDEGGWVRSIRISAGQEPIFIAAAEPGTSVTIRGKAAVWTRREVTWRAEWTSAHPCRWLAREGQLALEVPPRLEAIDVTITVASGDSGAARVGNVFPSQRIEAEASATGVQLRFADSLATQVAADRDQWRVADVFEVTKSSAPTTVNIGTDDRSIFLGLTGAAPASVLAIGYRLKTVEGEPLEGEILVRTED